MVTEQINNVSPDLYTQNTQTNKNFLLFNFLNFLHLLVTKDMYFYLLMNKDFIIIIIIIIIIIHIPRKIPCYDTKIPD